MNLVDFFTKLGVLYTTDEDDETYNERIRIYSDLLNKKIKEQMKEPDFEKTFDYIVESYPYRTFPNFNYIADNLKYKPNTQDNLKLRGFKVKTDKGIYDFWDYIPYTAEVKSIRGFKVIEEIKD